MRALALALFLLGVTAPASAQTPEDQAKIHFQAGALHYERGAYEKAIEEFNEAYRLTQRAALLYNIAQAYEKLGKLPEARDHFKRYLESGQAEPGEVATLEDKIKTLEERIAAGATPKPRRERPTRPFKVLKWVALGTTVVTLAASTYFALDASAMESDIEALESMGVDWSPELQDKWDRGERDVILSWVLGGVGVAALATTTWFFLADSGHARDQSAWERDFAVTPTVGRGTVGASVLWRF